MVFIIVSIIAILLIIASASRSNTTSGLCKNILDSQNMTDVVSSIGYGRLYPYYTGMPTNKVREILQKEGQDISEFDNRLLFAEMTGFLSGIPLPKPNYTGIQSIEFRINDNKEITSFSIDLKDNSTKMQAYLELNKKFGHPFSADSEFIIWREKYMVITLNNKTNSIYVIDGRL